MVMYQSSLQYIRAVYVHSDVLMQFTVRGDFIGTVYVHSDLLL